MRTRLPAAELPETGLRGRAPPFTSGNRAPEPASPGRDPQIAQIFRNMRAATRLSREVLARHLATTPSTIEDLESGAVASLPHWRETSRIVRSYCEILRLDPQPILWHMQKRLEAAGTHVEPAARTGRTQPPGGPPSVLRRERTERRQPGRTGRRARTMFALSAPLVAAAAALYIAQAMPTPVYRLLGLLPAPLAGAARAGMDALVLYSAPRRDGLRWVDVGDPQLRKVDKLQSAAQ
jgi:DNA-binding XRE family transcriptional regulator